MGNYNITLNPIKFFKSLINPFRPTIFVIHNNYTEDKNPEDGIIHFFTDLNDNKDVLLIFAIDDLEIPEQIYLKEIGKSYSDNLLKGETTMIHIYETTDKKEESDREFPEKFRGEVIPKCHRYDELKEDPRNK